MKEAAEEKRIRNQVVLIDLAAGAAAYLLALLIRYRLQMSAWMVQWYGTWLLLMLAVVFVSSVLSDESRKLLPPDAMDAAEQLTRVLRNTARLLLLYVCLLVVTRQALTISRLFLGIDLLIWIAVDFTGRMLYGRRLKKQREKALAGGRLLVITTARDRWLVSADLNNSLPTDTVVERIRCAEEGEETVLSAEDTKDCTGIFVCLTEIKEELRQSLIRQAEEAGLDLSVAVPAEAPGFVPEKPSLSVEESSIHAPVEGSSAQAPAELRMVGKYPAVFYPAMNRICRQFGVDFRAADAEEAAIYIRNHLRALSGRYICLCGTRTAMRAHDDIACRAVLNGAALVLAEEERTAAFQRRRGYPGAEAVSGGVLLEALLARSADGSVSHYLYTEDAELRKRFCEEIRNRFPGVRLADAETEADIVWVGLAPDTRDRWMAAHKGIYSGVMIGVGAVIPDGKKEKAGKGAAMGAENIRYYRYLLRESFV